MNRMAPLLLVLGLVAGAFLGRLVTHQIGGSYALPERPDPNQWRVISPGLEEGIGRAGAGRVTHVVDGALSIATHVFFRPDMVVPQFRGEAHGVDIELAPDSGTLLVQIGKPPVQAIELRPNAFRSAVSGEAWISRPGVRRFELRASSGRLSLTAGAESVDIGGFTPGRLELSSIDDWARVAQISVTNGSGDTVLFSDFRQQGPPRSVLDQGTVVGAFVGVLLVFLLMPLSGSAVVTCLFGLAPAVSVLFLPRDVWLHGVERLYLSHIPPSDLAGFTLLCALSCLLFFALLKLVRMVAGVVPSTAKFGFGLWLSLGLICSGVGLWLHGGSGWAWSVIWVCLGTGALDARGKAHPAWWYIDAVAWPLVAFWGPDQAAFLVILWRVIGIIGSVSLWLRTTPRVAVLMLLIGFLSLPAAAEAWVRTTSFRDAWQMNRLAGERPNEKGWEDPVAGWSNQCGEVDADASVRVVVAGGSSVGGAYQFGGEPEAFFTAVAHKTLCEQLPTGLRLRTQNFGDGDRNTYTISRTVDAHLKDADILVLYVGVNDVFTTQNTMTRKQREERAQGVFQRFSWLPDWFNESRLAVGLSLWFRARPDLSQEQVADVPLPDALDNHRIIVNAAKKKGIRVLLLTEYVQSAQRGRLVSYTKMQQSMVGDGVRWADVSSAFVDVPDSVALVDSNHLSREGNAQLGRFLADELKPWIYGSSR